MQWMRKAISISAITLAVAMTARLLPLTIRLMLL